MIVFWFWLAGAIIVFIIFLMRLVAHRFWLQEMSGYFESESGDEYPHSETSLITVAMVSRYSRPIGADLAMLMAVSICWPACLLFIIGNKWYGYDTANWPFRGF